MNCMISSYIIMPDSTMNQENFIVLPVILLRNNMISKPLKNGLQHSIAVSLLNNLSVHVFQMVQKLVASLYLLVGIYECLVMPMWNYG